MSDTPIVDPSGTNPADPSGNPVEPVNPNPNPETVAYSNYQKVLSEKKNTAARNRTLEEENAELKAANKAREEQELKEKEDWKTIVQKRDAELETTNAELSKLREERLVAQKFAAFKTALNGNIDSKFLPLVDLDGIAINPETGDIDEMTVTKTVEVFRRDYGRVIDVPGVNQVPDVAPSNGPVSKLTREEWLKLPAKDMAARMKELMDNEKAVT